MLLLPVLVSPEFAGVDEPVFDEPVFDEFEFDEPEFDEFEFDVEEFDVPEPPELPFLYHLFFSIPFCAI